MAKLSKLILSMLKVGVIGFGGGNALIPVIEQEVVKEKKLITKDEYDKDIVAATLTPGALPVELASGVGFQCAGVKGMIAGGVMMALPGAVITVILLSVLGQLDTAILRQIQYASIGITAFIMCLLTQYISGTVKAFRYSKKRWIVFVVIAGVFLLSAGKNLYGIFQVDRTPIFSVSTVNVLLVAFFAILYTQCRFSALNIVVTALVGGSYLLCVGKAQVFARLLGAGVNDGITAVTAVAMLLLSILGLYWGGKGKTKKGAIEFRPIAKKISVWILFFVILSIPALFFVSGQVVRFDGHGLLSSFMSFGGGDAYLTIADGLFVPDYIGENEFYNHLVLIVNVLPGSILCKTLTGVGYSFGVTVSGGSMIAGVWMALAGFACSVAASCAVFYLIFHAYEWLECMNVFCIVKKSIRVIVSGLLLTVMTGLIKSGMATNSNPDLPWFTVLLMIFGIYIINMVLLQKTKSKNLALIVISLIISMSLSNFIGI